MAKQRLPHLVSNAEVLKPCREGVAEIVEVEVDDLRTRAHVHPATLERAQVVPMPEDPTVAQGSIFMG